MSGGSLDAGRVRAFLRRRGVQDVGWSVLGVGAQLALGIASSIVLGRALGPTGLGLFSVAMSLIFLVSGLADVGWSAAYIRIGSPMVGTGQDVRRLHWTFLGARLATGVLVASAMVAGGGRLLPWLGFPEASLLLSLGAAGVGLVLAAGGHYTTTLQILRRQRSITLIRAASAGTRIACLALLAVAHALTARLALVVAAAALALEFALLAHSAGRSQALWPPTWRRPPRSWIAVSGWTALSSLSFTLIGQSDTLLLAGLADARQVGFWSAASRIAGLVTLGSGAIWAVAFPYAAGAVAHGQLERYLRHARRAALATTAVCVAGTLLAPWGLALFFGHLYAPATATLRWLLGAAGLQAAGVLLLPVAYRLQREKALGLMAAGQCALNVSGDALLIPRYGAAGSAFVSLVMHAVGLAVIATLVRPAALQALPEVPAAVVADGRREEHEG